MQMRHGFTPEQEATLRDVPGFDAEAEDTFDAWVEAFRAWQQKEGHQRWPTESLKASAEERRLTWRHRHMQTRK